MTESRHAVSVTPLTYADGEQTGVHSHDFHQLSWARSGVLTVEVESARWVVPPMRAVWVPAGVEHNLRAHGRTEIRPVHIDAGLGPASLIGIAVVGVGALLRELIDALIDVESPGPDERRHLEALLLLQLERLAVTPLQLPMLHEPRLEPIQRALSADPGDRRRLQDWGRHCGASERTLVRLFAAEAGTSFGHWRTQLRLHHALIDLAQGHTVTATAHRCGYRSTSAFIESFRSVLGTTPGRFFLDKETGDVGSVVGVR